MTSASSTHTTLAGSRRPNFLRLPTSLRSVLGIAFVAVSLAPVALALSVAVARTSAQARQQVAAQMNSVLQLKIAALNANINTGQTTLRLIVNDRAVKTNLTALLGSAQPDASVNIEVNQSLAAFLNTKGASFTEYFVYNRDGSILASTNGSQVGKIMRSQPYFKASLVGEYIQPPYYEIGSDSLALILTEPLTDERGIVIGVLAGRLNMAGLAALMAERAGLGETGETYLISPENNYLVTPSRFEGYPLNRSYHSQAIDSALAGGSGSGEYVSYRGRDVIGAYQWVPNLQLGVIAEYDQAEALAASQQATLFSLAVAVIAGALAILIGVVISARITRPVIGLTRTTQKLAGGDLTVRAQIREQNEIGALADSFNHMAGQLEDNLKALEASVKEAQLATAMAREANRLKSEFLATMSHELRTPLNAMIGFAELLMAGLSGPLNEKQHHKIERIHLNSRRLLELINNLLDLAKIEAGRVEVLHEPFQPAKLIASVQAQTESLAEKHGLAFTVTLDPQMPETVIGDEARIAQVLNNLLSNAFKFTPKGRVELSAGPLNADYMWFSVKDTGIGIPPHALEFIFEEFRQVDGTSQRAYGGSGLGLAITRNLARIMGGEVRVTSVLGEGSTFTVTLPMVTLEVLRQEMVA